MVARRLIYAIGTTVRLKPEVAKHWGFKEGVITDVTYDGYASYGVEGCAWFDHSDLLFISNPTKASLAKARKILADEEEEDEE